MARVTVYVHGQVQGVGFRWWIRDQARELGLEGYARNLPDGRVEVVAQGDRDVVDRLVGLLDETPSTRHRPGDVSGVDIEQGSELADLDGFSAQ